VQRQSDRKSFTMDMELGLPVTCGDVLVESQFDRLIQTGMLTPSGKFGDWFQIAWVNTQSFGLF
jgi:hypothetical protein